MKLLIATGFALATAVVAGAATVTGVGAEESCCTTQTLAANPKAFIVSATPAAPVTASLKGSVVFEGEMPKMEELEITADKSKGCVADGEVNRGNRTLMINKDTKGIANVVLMVEVKGTELKLPEAPIVLDQKACRFEPHVAFIPAGATVDFVNSDTVSHNVNLVAKKNDSWNKTIPAGGKTSSVLAKTDQIRIKCDIHPWMESHLMVVDTPFVALSGADGTFELPKLPPGEHKVEYWHEKLGKGSEKITVGADGTVSDLTIKLSAEKKKKGGRRRR